MNIIKSFCVLLLLFNSQPIFAYGSSSSTKACAKPKFSEFKPASNSEVTADSEFAFLASKNTEPKTIKVTVKQQSVDVTIIPTAQGYQVTGKLPSNLTGAARINISADTTSHCPDNDGWLVIITK
jgi:hypothetical protein